MLVGRLWRRIVPAVVVGVLVCMIIAWPGVVLAAVLAGRRPHARSHRGRCGCDLTGNVSGVCPECGEKIRVRHEQR